MNIILERDVRTATQKYLKHIEYEIDAAVFAQIGQFTACCQINECALDCDAVSALKKSYFNI